MKSHCCFNYRVCSKLQLQENPSYKGIAAHIYHVTEIKRLVTFIVFVIIYKEIIQTGNDERDERQSQTIYCSQLLY